MWALVFSAWFLDFNLLSIFTLTRVPLMCLFGEVVYSDWMRVWGPLLCSGGQRSCWLGFFLVLTWMLLICGTSDRILLTGTPTVVSWLWVCRWIHIIRLQDHSPKDLRCVSWKNKVSGLFLLEHWRLCLLEPRCLPVSLLVRTLAFCSLEHCSLEL